MILDKELKSRKVAVKKTFTGQGTWGGMYAAQGWLHDNGYSYGSTTHHPHPVAIARGEYNFPQKWHNFTAQGRKDVDGIMFADSWREGTVTVIIFE